MSYPIIGIGGGGKCRVYYSEKFGRKVVEKILDPNFIRAKSANAGTTTLMENNFQKEESFIKELTLMIFTKLAKLDCCVEVLGYETNPFKIIMEYCEGGDLRKVLDTYEIPIQDKITMISQILLAIKEIHGVGLIHGDLKCANIFLVNKYVPGDISNIKIKIGDFGLSEFEGNFFQGGTRGFMAPEAYIGGSFEADIYSIGKVMLEIMTELPVQMIAAININNLYTIKNKLPKFLNVSEFYNVVIPCLCPDFTKRPNAKELFELYHGLMAYWVICEKINDLMLEKYKIGDKVPVDTHEHLLTLSNDQMRGYDGGKWYCNNCDNQNNLFLSNTLSFNCQSCQYDLCQKCIAEHNYIKVNNKMAQHTPKGKKTYVSTHVHYLLLSSKEDRTYDSWVCDGCKATFSGYIYSFHCKKCNYDLCLLCYEKYFQTRKEDGCHCIIF